MDVLESLTMQRLDSQISFSFFYLSFSAHYFVSIKLLVCSERKNLSHLFSMEKEKGKNNQRKRRSCSKKHHRKEKKETREDFLVNPTKSDGQVTPQLSYLTKFKSGSPLPLSISS